MNKIESPRSRQVQDKISKLDLDKKVKKQNSGSDFILSNDKNEFDIDLNRFETEENVYI